MKHGVASAWTPWESPVVIPEAYLRLPLSAGGLRLAGALCRFVDKELKCWPSNRALLALFPPGTSERTLQRAKAELESVGVLQQFERTDPSGRATSNVYRLMVPVTGDGVGATELSPHPGTHGGVVPVTAGGDVPVIGDAPGTSQKELLNKEEGIGTATQASRTPADRVTFDAGTGRIVGLTEAARAAFARTFPLVDLAYEIGRCELWLQERPTRRKNIWRTLRNWLGNAQSDAAKAAKSAERPDKWADQIEGDVDMLALTAPRPDKWADQREGDIQL